jgi:2'-hydroxyisoflavone reductase
MKILILGGTHFLGRHIVEQLLQSNDSNEIILFNRGKTNPDLYKNDGVQTIHGDREVQPKLIKDVNTDVVIDCCGHFPTGLTKLA